MSDSVAVTADDYSHDAEFLGHPIGLYVCFATELWERFSFYGMKYLLLLYLTKYHLFSDAAGLDVLGSYAGLVYALPVIGGLIADRFDAARSIGVAFVVLLLAYLALSVLSPDSAGAKLIYANIFISFFAVFAIRGIYFALLEENKTPLHVTGAAVGMVSLIGYTPDIFFAAIAGRILDANPGVEGHHNYFLFLAGIMLAGIAAVAWLIWLRRQGVKKLWPAEI